MKPQIINGETYYLSTCCLTWKRATDLCCSREWMFKAGVGNHTVQGRDAEMDDAKMDAKMATQTPK